MTEGAITPEGLEALKAELHELETDGRRDMAVMTSPPVLDAFERYVAAAGELRTLLGARTDADAAMLAQIRAAVGDGS